MKNCYSISLFAALSLVLVFSGCRQPVVNTGAGAPRVGLFDFSNRPRLFGGGTSVLGNQQGLNSQYAQGTIRGPALGGGASGGLGWGDTWRNRWLSGSGSGGQVAQAQTNGFIQGNQPSRLGSLFRRNQVASNVSTGGFSNAGFSNGGNSGQIAPGGFTGTTGQIDPRTQQQYANLSGQVQNMNQRLTSYDADNQLLHTEVASLKQKLQLASDYNYQLKQQLAGTTNQIQSIQQEKSTTEQQLAATQLQMQQLNQTAEAQRQQFALQQQQLQNVPNGPGANNNQLASYRNGNNGGPFNNAGSGGAILRANNSLMERFNQIRIPGGQARMDGDVIRIEFPSDRLFVPGRYDIQPGQTPMLQNLVQTIRESFPQQIIGVEAHWDNTPLQPAGTTHHQLTATQSLAVLNYLTRLGVPEGQLFNMAMGSNRPRHNQGTIGGVNPNRRIEIVIYPESVNGT